MRKQEKMKVKEELADEADFFSIPEDFNIDIKTERGFLFDKGTATYTYSIEKNQWCGGGVYSSLQLEDGRRGLYFQRDQIDGVIKILEEYKAAHDAAVKEEVDKRYVEEEVQEQA